MLAVGLVLALLMGAVLGLFGGGGSVLTVPLLMYVFGLDAKTAIATSLVVVGATSAVGTLQHARQGNVAWKKGLSFGLVAMLGAYAGGRVTSHIPAWALMTLFVLLMVVTGAVMLFTKPENSEHASEVEAVSKEGAVSEESGEVSLLKSSLIGALVGTLTGLVGAGGGFIVVPALALFAKLDMKRAVGTSLMVVTLNAAAGFAGQAGHVTIDLGLTGMVALAAMFGTVAGVFLASRLSPGRLKRLFGGFVLVMATYIAYRELAASAMADAFFVERWPWYVGGLAIGFFILIFLVVGGRTLGVSTGFQDACAVPFEPAVRRSWRLPFLLGIVAGGVVAAFAGGSPHITTALGSFDVLVRAPLAAKAAVLTGGGVLIGFGTRLAGGCTSGHGIVGTAQLAPSSLIATGSFMATGFVVTNLLWLLAGA